MTDLTDKWKKGELPSGEYYIIDDLGLHTTDRYYPSHGFGAELPQSVLGRVPSYEEYQKLLSDQLAKNEGKEINAELEYRLAMVKANGKYPDRISRLKSRVVALSEENTKLKSKLQLKETAYDFDTARLEEENAQLKELLRECKEWLEYLGIYKYTEDSDDCVKLLSELNEVLK